ncbi:MAG: YraN family protein [Alphaproteobacteria bacterium]
MRYPADDREKRQGAQRRGVRAEALAAWWLRLKGYQVVTRDLRTPLGQIDLVVRRGRVLAIVEVKRRGDLRDALESLTPRQQARLTAAAETVRAYWPALARLDMRFDLVLVVPGRRPRHLVDAWRPGF